MRLQDIRLFQFFSDNGKLISNDIKEVIKNNSHAPHMAKPKLVYISNSTELGTIYKRRITEAIRGL
ncbi:hypothetical protein [Francisella orientalis]|uniref:hypothetical protein n=1 Tax=Francisella orientalis TaxID=299583 RepID=UPI0002DFC6DF|nr:hypothetical protein [Francisella orientalis]AHB99249.1 hypothetical protein M973_06805 [Francisella orientalis LADL 07-285A]